MEDLKRQIKNLSETLGYEYTCTEFIDLLADQLDDLQALVCLKDAMDTLLPSRPIKVAIGVEIEVKGDLEQEEIARIVCQKFKDDPRSTEEWFVDHLDDWYELA